MFFEPSVGTIFWMTIIFLIVVFVLGKFAWKPILSALKERENSVALALKNAAEARREVENLEKDKLKVIEDTKVKKEALLKEGFIQRDKIIADSREKAKIEADKIMEAARKKLTMEREAALLNMKNQIAELSIDIATRLVKTELQQTEAQEKLVNQLLKDVELN